MQETEKTVSETSSRLEENRKQLKKMAVIAAIAIALALAFAAVVIRCYLVPANYYNHGQDAMLQEEYSEAAEWFEKANGYRDSEEQLQICKERISAAEN